MTGPRIGELFAGYGGLGMGVQAVLGGDIAWFSEFDAAPSKILAHHWPTVPNHGDITKIDWSTVEPVDILTGGFPCQDVSLAGARVGFTETSRSGLWSEFARAIAVLKPGMVLIENVRGLLSATAAGSVEPDPWGVGDGATRPVINALGAVLGDLAELGYDAEWCGVRASDAGAPHGRFRVFIVAHPSGIKSELWGTNGNVGSAKAGNDGAREERQRVRNSTVNSGKAAANVGRIRSIERDQPAELAGASANRPGVPNERGSGHPRVVWGPYDDAVKRWESVLGRPAPFPTAPRGKDLLDDVSVHFGEWLMGVPEGHVTDPAIWAEMSEPAARSAQFKALGNGVVPQQAALALRLLLSSGQVAA